jgi:hypothetical protein
VILSAQLRASANPAPADTTETGHPIGPGHRFHRPARHSGAGAQGNADHRGVDQHRDGEGEAQHLDRQEIGEGEGPEDRQSGQGRGACPAAGHLAQWLGER